MKTNRLILTVVTLVMAVEVGLGTVRGATNDVGGLLQKGLFEEEANHNLDAAIQAYEGVVTQTEKNRQFAATAVFRLGECYRKQGKTNEANAQYQRILRDFSDQPELAKLSRQQLGSAAELPEAGDGTDGVLGRLQKRRADEVESKQLMDIKKLSPEKRRVAVQQMFPNPVLNSLMQKMTETEQELAKLKNTFGDSHPDVTAKVAVLKSIYQQIDDQVDAALAGRSKNSDGTRADVSQEAGSNEAYEVKRIQAMIKDSPDLINVPNGGATPLYTAARGNHLTVARFLLDSKADTEARGYQPWTPLIVAAENGNREVTELLLERGADVNAAAEYPTDSRFPSNPRHPSNGGTALHYAAEHGFKAVAEVLLAHGAKVDARTIEGKTPLHIAAARGFKTVVELLLAHGADVNARRKTGATPLLEAAYGGNAVVVNLLLANKAEVTATDTNGATALYMAADTGYPVVAESLIAHGADVNLPTKSGMTPLMEAVAQKRVEVARVLLGRGADTRARLSEDDRGLRGWTALHFAVEKDLPELVQALLEKNAEVDAVGQVMAAVDLNKGTSSSRYHAFTPLMMALYEGRSESARVLVSHKADVNFRNPDAERPLLAAVKQGSKDMVELLLDNQADAKVADQNGWSVLQFAVIAKQRDIAGLLLKHGADANAQLPNSEHNYGGWTALHFTIPSHDTEMAALLINGGADVNAQNAIGDTPLHVAMKYLSSAARETKPMIELLLADSANVNLVNNQGQAPLDMIDANNKNEIAELLRQRGAVSVLERRTIRITRSGQAAPGIVFRKDANGYNHHTLFEVLGYIYPYQLGLAYWSQTVNNNRQPELPGFYFPDFTHIRIRQVEHRELAGDRTNTVSLDLQAALNSGDCSANLPLGWGDIVELPELDHNVNENWGGLSDSEKKTLKKCLERHIRIIVKGRETRVTLAPEFGNTPVNGPLGGNSATMHTITLFGPNSAQTSANQKTELAGFWLSDVVRSANIILASSDTTRIKVKRPDAKTGKTAEMVFNLGRVDAQTDLWLQDGDVIEIPERTAE